MPRLKKLEIKGFRSLKDVVWEPGNLNVVIGENGSGKSNLLSALKLLQESANKRLRDSVLAQGGLRRILWDHRASEIEFWINFEVEAGGPGLPPWGLQYQLAVIPFGFGAGYSIDHETVTYHSAGNPVLLLESDPFRCEIKAWNGDNMVDMSGPDGVQRVDPVYEGETAFSLYGTVEPRFVKLLRLFLNLRVYQDLTTHGASRLREAAVARVEQRLDSDGQNLAPLLHTLYEESRDFKRTVNGAMIAAFGSEFEELSFPPAADQKIQLAVRWKSLKDPISAASLSDGTLRFLMLVAALANPEPVPLIAIDEPEAGLHPRMLPIIAELAAAASEKSTVIFTTHSPQFLDAFPEECVPTTTVAELTDGATRLTRLDGDDLKRWLKDYSISLGQMLVSGELEALAP